MLNLLGDLPLFSHFPSFPRIGPGLHAMLGSCGYQNETSSAYDWAGLDRGNATFGLFQYTLAGEGELRFERRTFRIRPGQAMVLKVPHDHRYRLPVDSASWTFFYIILQGQEAARILHELIAMRGPVWTLDARSPIIRQGAHICRRTYRREITSPYQSSELAYGFLMAMGEHCLPVDDHGGAPAFLREVIAYCEENYDQTIGLEDLAAVSTYSRYHFSRLFKKWMGIAPGEYLQSVRLNQACRLLNDHRLSVKQVAYRSGFNDYNYFCRAFRKHFGQSPGSFKKSGLAPGYASRQANRSSTHTEN